MATLFSTFKKITTDLNPPIDIKAEQYIAPRGSVSGEENVSVYHTLLNLTGCSNFSPV